MIIDDEHRIAFVHIPKCAGTTIRQILEPFDSNKGAYAARVDLHPQLGMLDYVHIPLFVLKEQFPKELELIKQYWSFVVVRDPFARFASSVSQRIKKYGDKPFQEMDKNEIMKEVESCINFLSSYKEREKFLPHDYIHFQPQVDYVYLEDEKIIDDIFFTDQISELQKKLNCVVQSRIGGGEAARLMEKRNKSVVYRSDLVRNIMSNTRLLRRLIVPMLPEVLRLVLRKNIYVDRDVVFSSCFDARIIRDFVEDYYRDDIAMYKRVAGKL